MIKTRYLRNILFICIVTIIVLLVFIFSILSFSVTRILSENSKHDSEVLAQHLSSMLITEDDELKSISIPPDLSREINKLKNDFNLHKIKIFTPEGEVVYSTDQKDIGFINTKKYFRDVVVSGKTYASTIKKGALSLEDQETTVDVIETYMPIISGSGTIIGVLEIYYDIAFIKNRIDRLVLVSIFTVLILSIGFLTAVIVISVKADRTVIERNRAEEELIRHRDKLDVLVKERSEELENANRLLKEDISKRKLTEKELVERMNLSELNADVGLSLNRGGSLREILRDCAESMVRHLDAALVRIWTYNEAERVLELEASAGLYTHIDGAHGRVPLGQYKIGQIALEKSPHLTNSVDSDPRFHDQEWVKRKGLVSFAGHPLTIGEKLVGVMALFSRKPLTDVVTKYLASVSDIISLGIEQHNADEALKIYQGKLENIVDERTAELTATNELLKEEIDDRREAEKRESTLLIELKTIFEHLPVGIIYLDRDFRIISSNTFFNELTGFTEDDLIGKRCYDVVGEYSSDSSKTGNAKICSFCKKNECFKLKSPTTIERPLGDKILRVTTVPELDRDGDIIRFIELVEDITERKAIEAEVIRSSQLASLGELAAGVAHEINNPMNGIVNYAQLLINKDIEPDIANRIIKEGNRITSIVSSLLSFARDNRKEKESVHIREILDESLALSQTQLRKDGIKLNLQIPNGLPEINVNPHQIEQVFLNIISNARYALNEKYTGSHKNKILEITCKTNRSGNGRYLRIVFHDRGTGISSHFLDKVMNPFFSTKQGDRGTGLGLSISHGIIKDHNGNITIKSSSGKFTEVVIELPLTEKPAKV
jgi:PAS domain S-box-containing protein